MLNKTRYNQKIVSGLTDTSQIQLSIDRNSPVWQLIESSPDGLGILSHDFVLIICNQSFAEALGYTVEEMIGKYAWEWDARYDSKEEFLLDVAVAGCLANKFETRHRKKDNSVIDVEVSLTSTTIDGNGIYMFVSKDITEQKKEKRHLLQTRFAMDNAQDCCTWFDDQGKIVYVNHSACKTLGYSQNQLIGKKIHDIDPGFDKPSFVSLVDRLKIEGSILFESQHITNEGKSFPVEISANYFSEGKSFYICTFDRDITARKIAEQAMKDHSETLESSVVKRTAELRREIEKRNLSEQALQKTQATFKALAENSLDVVMRFDRQHRLLYVNPAVRSVSTYHPEELIGKTFGELKRAQLLAPVLDNALEKVFSTGKSHQLEFQMPTGIWIESLLSPEIDHSGAVTAVVSTSRNITAHKETLAQLNIYNQLQLLLTDLASTFINQPLHETNTAINKALTEVATFVQADHAYIFHYDYIQGEYTNTYAYNRQGHIAQTTLPYFAYLDYFNNKQGDKILHIADCRQLPEDHGFRSFMIESGIKSLIIVPMLNGAELTGCVGFETYGHTHEYFEQERQLLSIFAQLVVNVDKRNETDRILREQYSFQEIIASIAVRFVAVNDSNLNELITSSLHQIGSFFRFDRSSFYFEEFSQTSKLQVLEVYSDKRDALSSKSLVHPVIEESLIQKDALLKKQAIFHFPTTDKMHEKYSSWKPYFTENNIKSAIYLSCKTDQNVYGVLGFEMQKEHAQWSQGQINGLVIIAQIFGYSFANLEARKALLAAKETLESRVKSRTNELMEQIQAREKAMEDLAKAQASLLEASRSAGMAEVATNVLHNVGNVLNSINVSCNLLTSTLKQSRLTNFSKTTQMLQEHADNLAQFLTNDQKGQHIPQYLVSLAPQLEKEQQTLLDEVELLGEKINHIKKIVSMQQGYGRIHGVFETFSPENLLEDALSLSTSVLNKYTVTVKKDFSKVPDIVTDKHKVLQILLNLITNAANALGENTENSNNIITLGLAQKQSTTVSFMVKDNGIGILEENINKIFQYGFTTRKHGYGFGLHSCALSANQLGGSLHAASDGLGTGAIFTLELPVHHIETVK